LVVGRGVAATQRVRVSGERVGFVQQVSDRMVDALTVIGPPGYCRDRLAYYRQQGVTCPHISSLLRTRDGIDRTLTAVAPALAGGARGKRSAPPPPRGVGAPRRAPPHTPPPPPP